jgi:hypothetical protein
MPQLAILALVGAGVYAGYRWLVHATREIAAEARRAEDELRARAAGPAIQDMGALEYDPASGVYRPKGH